MMIALGIASCGARSASSGEASASETEAAPQLAVADFNADSAFAFVKRQCDFGARVPLTPAHAQCGDWIEAQLQRFCDRWWFKKRRSPLSMASNWMPPTILVAYSLMPKNAFCWWRTGIADLGRMPTPMKVSGCKP